MQELVTILLLVDNNENNFNIHDIHFLCRHVVEQKVLWKNVEMSRLHEEKFVRIPEEFFVSEYNFFTTPLMLNVVDSALLL
jgi:hypothetical protein